jgi:hypothetical protein
MGVQAINREYLKKLEAFGHGLSRDVIVIKYEAITPDMDLLCFQTFGTDGKNYYFAMLECDFINTIRYARKVINSRFSKVLEFIPPVEKQKGSTELEQKSIFTEDGNRLLLARVDRPNDDSYWATQFTVWPGEDITKSLKHVKKEDVLAARRVLAKIINDQPRAGEKSPSGDFLHGWNQKMTTSTRTPELLKTNDTNLAISLFKNAANEWEAFYNYVK